MLPAWHPIESPLRLDGCCMNIDYYFPVPSSLTLSFSLAHTHRAVTILTRLYFTYYFLVEYTCDRRSVIVYYSQLLFQVEDVNTPIYQDRPWQCVPPQLLWFRRRKWVAQACRTARVLVGWLTLYSLTLSKRERERERERTRKEGGKEERQRNGGENDWSGSLSWSVKIRFERGGPAEQKNPSLAQWSSTSIDVQGRLLLLLDPATVPLLIELSYSDMLYCFCQTKSPLTLSSTPLSLGFLERQPLFTDIYVPFFFKCRSLTLSLIFQ